MNDVPAILIHAYLDGELTDADRRALGDWLRLESGNVDLFVAECRLHSELCDIQWGGPRGTGDGGREMVGSPTVDLSVGAASVGAAVELPHQPGAEIPGPEPLVPPIVLDLFPTSHYPLATSHSFVGGPVFSYMVSAVIVGMMLLGAWAYKITHYQQIAENRSQETLAIDRPELVFVGRITGMVDCRWADPSTAAYAGAYVPLDRKYALASGLMQITYDSGAKVILEGPCTYEVESRAGGYLSLGKLTAKVQKGLGVRDQGSEEVNPTSPGPWPLTPDPFCVRTPTAVVTDLGTEFGVEVSEEGNTTSHVFRGSVKVQVVAPEKGTGPICRNGPEGASHKLDLSPFPTQGVVLRASESARVEKGEAAGGVKLLRLAAGETPPKFARRLIEPPKVLDLLDILAGGNGTGARRERGINPVGGFPEPFFVGERRSGDGQYWPVNWQRLIDGVVVPNGRAGAVRLDSAGHAFDGFPETSGATYGPIWSRAADSNPSERGNDPGHWIFLIGECRQFMPEGRGLLGFCPNVGITFDLAPMRRMWRDTRPTRLRAVAGLVDARFRYPDADGLADLWVFIDGQPRMKRMGLRPQDGPINVDVAIGPDDRYLTLVSTDGGNGDRCDWVVVGDPVLEMVSTEDSGVRETHQGEKHRRGAFHAPYKKEDQPMNQ